MDELDYNEDPKVYKSRFVWFWIWLGVHFIAYVSGSILLWHFYLT